MARTDMNKVAVLVTLAEGKKKSLPIGQVKEVLKCLRDLCRKEVDVWYAVQHYLRYAKKDQLARKKAKAKKKTA